LAQQLAQPQLGRSRRWRRNSTSGSQPPASTCPRRMESATVCTYPRDRQPLKVSTPQEERMESSRVTPNHSLNRAAAIALAVASVQPAGVQPRLSTSCLVSLDPRDHAGCAAAWPPHSCALCPPDTCRCSLLHSSGVASTLDSCTTPFRSGSLRRLPLRGVVGSNSGA